jgi:hypothetical protein
VPRKEPAVVTPAPSRLHRILGVTAGTFDAIANGALVSEADLVAIHDAAEDAPPPHSCSNRAESAVPHLRREAL